MVKVTFNRAVQGGNYDLYSCDAGAGDHSGVYVQKETADDLAAELKRITAWLIRLAEQSERQAKETRHVTIRTACEADARNFRASAKKGLKLLKDYEG